MASIDSELQDFNRFAREMIVKNGPNRTIDELFDQWRIEHPPSDDAKAIEASARDVDLGDAANRLTSSSTKCERSTIYSKWRTTFAFYPGHKWTLTASFIG